MEDKQNTQTMSSATLLDDLLRLRIATYTRTKIGFCYRGVINLPCDSSNYYYKYGTPLSNILLKKLSKPTYKKMSDNTSTAITTIKQIYIYIYI